MIDPQHFRTFIRGSACAALGLATLIAFGCEQSSTNPVGGEKSDTTSERLTPATPAQPEAGPSESAMPSGSTSMTPPERPAQSRGEPSAVAPSAGVEMAMPRPDPPAATTTEAEEDPNVARFAGLAAPKPPTWQYRAPRSASGMRKAEYSVPGVDGADQADIIVYQFPGGGTFETNVERWKSQFKAEGDAAIEPKVEKFEADGMQVGVAELSGAYRGMNSPEFAAGHTLIAAMIESTGDPIFVQLVGPTPTVNANREAFLAMLKGVSRSEPMK